MVGFAGIAFWRGKYHNNYYEKRSSNLLFWSLFSLFTAIERGSASLKSKAKQRALSKKQKNPFTRIWYRWYEHVYRNWLCNKLYYSFRKTTLGSIVMGTNITNRRWTMSIQRAAASNRVLRTSWVENPWGCTWRCGMVLFSTCWKPKPGWVLCARSTACRLVAVTRREFL